MILPAALAVLVGVVLWFTLRGRDPGDDPTRFQGEWACAANGRPTPNTVRVEGDTWTYLTAGRPGRSYRVTLKPDATPKEIDLAQLGDAGRPVTFTHGRGKGSEVSLRGVYAFDGDAVTVVLAPGVEPRPTSLQTPADAQVLTLTRPTK